MHTCCPTSKACFGTLPPSPRTLRFILSTLAASTRASSSSFCRLLRSCAARPASSSSARLPSDSAPWAASRRACGRKTGGYRQVYTMDKINEIRITYLPAASMQVAIAVRQWLLGRIQTGLQGGG